MPSKKVPQKDRIYLGDHPSKEQIAEMEKRKQWIQDQWTDEERQKRCCGYVPPWHASEYKTDFKSAIFTGDTNEAT